MSASSSDGIPPIYTKTGDDGTTGLLFGGRVSRADAVIEVCGALDEAVAALGLGRSLLADHPLRPAFVVPGANASAALDLVRTFLRRAERRLIAGREDGVTVSNVLIAYVNRASDLAYALARRAAGEREEPLSQD